MRLSKQFAEGLQKDFLRIGEAGCYFLCLARGLEPNAVMRLYHDSVSARFMTEECYILDPVSILKLRGVAVSTVEKTVDANAVRGARLAIAHLSPNHFVVVQCNGVDIECVYDPYQGSNSLAVGSISSFRVFR